MIDKIIIILFRIKCKILLKKLNDFEDIELYYRNLKLEFHNVLFDIEEEYLIKKF